MNEPTSQMSKRVIAGAVLAVAGLAGGCATEPSAVVMVTMDEAELATAADLQRQMVADSQYMRQVFRVSPLAPERRHAINLADPGQYRFVMNRLRAAGKTPENSPQLFDRLEQTKQEAFAKLATGPAVTNVGEPAGWWCSSFILMGRQLRSGSSTRFVNAHPDVSCVGGAAYVYADIAAFNSNAAGTVATEVAFAAGEDFSGGMDFDIVRIDPLIPAVTGRANITDSFVIAEDAVGNGQLTYNVMQTSMEAAPPFITLRHPVVHPWIAAVNGGHIDMCQLRGDPAGCDYGVGHITAAGAFSGWLPNAAGVFTGIAAVKAGTGGNTGVAWVGDTANFFSFTTPYLPNDPTHIYLPAQGTLDVGSSATADCVVKSITSARFRLTKRTSGGACTTTSSLVNGFPRPIPANTGAVSFRAIAEFINDGAGSGDCSLTNIIRNEAVKPSLTLMAIANCGGVDEPIITSIGPGNTDILPNLVRFLNSCFAEGTAIRRADGSRTAIEAIKVGDKVISDSKGTVLTVTGVSHGKEIEPLVELRSDKGHTLRLTSKHPVVRASGEVVHASAITRGDRLLTDRGIARVTAVASVPYTGNVYNMQLGTPDEQARVGKRGTTLYAGGFLVGDSAMQQDIANPPRPPVAVSKTWQRDLDGGPGGRGAMTRILR